MAPVDFTISQALGSKEVSRKSVLCLIALLLVIPQGWISAWAWEQNLRGFYLLLISFFFSTLLVPFSIYLAIRFMVLDMPSDRKVHKAATPCLGGLAVYGAVVLTLLRNDQWSPPLVGLLLGGTVICLMGVWDDAKGLSAGFRLVGQLLASAIVVASGARADCVPGMTPGKGAIDAALTVLWLVGMTNAINFLDGIDGLAAGMGTLCSALFLSIAWPEKQRHLAYAASALSGACLGFLPYNWRPARVFLGDGGATFIGFMLAGLGIMSSHSYQNRIASVSTPLLILSIPIFDMIYTTLSRVRRGAVKTFKEWIEFTGRDHFHHRLMNLGMTAPGAVRFILLLNVCLGFGAIVIHHTSSRLASALLLGQTFLFFIAIVALMLLGRELTTE